MLVSLKSNNNYYASKPQRYNIGDVVLMNDGTYNGWLKCNGAILNQSDYPLLYNTILSKYNYRSIYGSGQPWRQQYFINSTQSGDITGWSVGTNPASDSIIHAQAVITRNYVYLLGGLNSPTRVLYAIINDDGTLGTWTTGNPLPNSISVSQAVVLKNYIYLLGSHTGIGNIVIYTSINSDGTLGTWVNGPALPQTINHAQAVVTNNYIYIIGGSNNGSTYFSTVYYASINSDGSLSGWNSGIPLPIPLARFQVSIIYNRLYILGGTGNLDIYYTVINSNGSLDNWYKSGTLPGVSEWSQSVVTKNYVYVTGIIQNTSGTDIATNLVFYAPINSDQSLGAWSSGYTLPASFGLTGLIVTKNRIYLAGGYINNKSVSTVYTAAINADGTLGSWSTGPSLTTAVFGPQCIVTKNKVYVIGGNWAGVPNVQCSYINPDGTLAGWYNANPLPLGLGYTATVVTSSKIYLLGGNNSGGGTISNIYYGSFTGGLNDYSAYQGYTTIDPNYFNIPDLSPYETRRDVGFFIKT